MPTFYSQSGFVILIERPINSNFSGTIFLDGNNFGSFNRFSNVLYLNEIGTYTFAFSSGQAGDPISFTIRDYDTNSVIAEVAEQVFVQNEELILNAGFDGETTKSLSLSYGLQSFSFTNPGTTMLWVCKDLDNGCDSTESIINGLPEPKIIGNLSNCSSGDYKGDITVNPSCEDSPSERVFIFKIIDKVTQELLYSRIECCCPVVTPIDNEPPGFVCTCPDWGKATSYNQTLFSASIQLREWVLSNAGSRADCKHIMAAKRIMGMEQPTYNDPPYSAPPAPATPN